MQVPNWVKIFLGGKGKLLWFLAAAMDPNILILNHLLLFSIVWVFLLKPAVLELELNDSEPSSVLWLGWLSLPGCCALSQRSQQAVGEAGAQGGCWEQLSHQVDKHNSIYREMLAERYFSLLAKQLRKPPASLLSLPCSSLPQALLSSGGTDEPEMRSLTTPLSVETGRSFGLFGFTGFKSSSSPNMGRETDSTGLRSGCSGQELLLWQQNSQLYHQTTALKRTMHSCCKRNIWRRIKTLFLS